MIHSFPRCVVVIALLLSLTSFVAGSSEAGDLQRLVKQLGSDKFNEREAATAALFKVGKPALSALQAAAKSSGDAEIRARAEKLILDIKDALVRPIDLTPYVNQKLKEQFHGQNPEMIWPPCPSVSRHCRHQVHRGRGPRPTRGGKPNKVEGIKVGRKAERLQFLHACSHCGGTPLNALIGKYVVHYEDKTTRKLKSSTARTLSTGGSSRASPTRHEARSPGPA